MEFDQTKCRGNRHVEALVILQKQYQIDLTVYFPFQGHFFPNLCSWRVFRPKFDREPVQRNDDMGPLI